MSGKGSGRRPTQISKEEEDLRWELRAKATSNERKTEILKLLEEFKNNDKRI